MPGSLARALSLAASERLLRFDADIDADASVQENWLDVTHTLTTAGYLAEGGDAEALCHALEDVILGDHGVRPIFVTHMIKTLLAARDESQALGSDPQHDRPLLACTRYLASRVREHALGSAIEDALRFLVDAKTPKGLSP